MGLLVQKIQNIKKEQRCMQLNLILKKNFMKNIEKKQGLGIDEAFAKY